jgi:lactoylglutathione lyase
MVKLVHTMIRVLDLEKSLEFYQAAFGMQESHRLDFTEFTLVYLRNDGTADFELELTYNKGREEAYTHGTGYGHIAFAEDDLDGLHQRLAQLGMEPTAIKEFKRGDELLARFFFVQDPDGYKVEVLERVGHDI